VPPQRLGVTNEVGGWATTARTALTNRPSALRQVAPAQRTKLAAIVGQPSVVCPLPTWSFGKRQWLIELASEGAPQIKGGQLHRTHDRYAATKWVASALGKTIASRNTNGAWLTLIASSMRMRGRWARSPLPGSSMNGCKLSVAAAETSCLHCS
jgi:hypothetical protein